MKEKFPSQQTHEEARRIEARLIEALKSLGHEHPEAQELMRQWVQAEEAVVKSDPRPEAIIESSMRRSQIYLEAGYVGEALETLRQAQEEARQEESAARQEPDLKRAELNAQLYWEITDEIERIEGEIKNKDI